MILKTSLRRFLPACLSVACLALGAATTVHADDVVKYPSTNPLVVLKVPKEWTSEMKDGSLLLMSADHSVVIVLSKEMAEEKTTPIESVKNFATGAGVTDIETKDLGSDEENGIKALEAAAKGKKNGTDYIALLLKMTLPNGGQLDAVCFGETEKVLKDDTAKTLLDSLRPAK